ncbi:hypothetical protein M153_10350000817, partial [Pseudoloma neurophilia]
MNSALNFMDKTFESKLSLSSIFTSLLPIFSSAISMYAHSSGSYLKVNYIFSIFIILASIVNLVASKMVKKFGEKFEVVQLGIFIGLAAQLALNLFRESKYKILLKLFGNIFQKQMFLNVSPLIFSILSNLIISMFFYREDAIILNTILNGVLIFYTLGISNYLYYDWRIMIAFLVIPAFLISLCLPSKDMKKTKILKQKRIQAFIGSLVLAITAIVVLTHLCESRLYPKINLFSMKTLKTVFNAICIEAPKRTGQIIMNFGKKAWEKIKTFN